MKFQTPYTENKKPKLDTGESMTEQSHQDECDINLILADYYRTGLMKHAKQNEGRYDDVSSIDYEKAMITVANVKSLFEGLPAELRKDFGNEPAKFLDFVQNPDNGEKLQKMGILKGNDGVDITGAITKAPTPTSVQNKAEAKEATNNVAQAPTEVSEGDS